MSRPLPPTAEETLRILMGQPPKKADPATSLSLLFELAQRDAANPPPPPPEPEPEGPGFTKKLLGSAAAGAGGMGVSAFRGLTEAATKVGLIDEDIRETRLNFANRADEALSTLPRFEKGVGGDLATAAGSTIPYAIPPLLGVPFGPPGILAGTMISGFMGASAHLDEQTQRRIAPEIQAAAEAGATKEELFELQKSLVPEEVTPATMATGAGLGALEMVPIGRGIQLARKAAKGAMRGGVFKTIFQAGAREGAEEAVQEGASELVHQGVNPGEGLDVGAAAYNAALGATVGVGMGGGMAAGGTAISALRESRAQDGAEAFAEEVDMAEDSEVIEAVAEELKNPAPDDITAAEEIKTQAESVATETQQIVDEIVDPPAPPPAEAESVEPQAAPPAPPPPVEPVDPIIADLQDDFAKIEQELKDQGDQMDVLGDSRPPAESETEAPISETIRPEPDMSGTFAEPEGAESETEANYDDAPIGFDDMPSIEDNATWVESNTADMAPEQKEEVEIIVDQIENAESEEEVEVLVDELEEIVGDDPVIPPPPQTVDEIADLEDRQEEVPDIQDVQTVEDEEVEDGETSDTGRLPEDAGSGRNDVPGAPTGDERSPAQPEKVPKQRGDAGPAADGAGDQPAAGGTDGGVSPEPTGSVSKPRGTERERAEDGGGPRVKSGTRARYAYQLPSTPVSVRPRSSSKQIKNALDVLSELSATNREPTSSELNTLAGYGGFGAVSQAFKARGHVTDSDRQMVEALRAVGGDEAVEGARASTQNAHYTALEISRGMWDALGSAGKLKGTILEPGAGIGVFAGTIPADIDPAVKMRMIERDPISSRIATILHPSDSVSPTNLSLLNESNTVEAAIGNVPFGKGPMHFEKKPYSLHDGVILKTLKAVKPGGIAALVTSRYTMDKVDSGARRAMGKMADLVAAVRLPRGTFEKDAGTMVVTDVLVFKKRLPGEPAPADMPWVLTKQQTFAGGTAPVPINKFFLSNPERVLGNPRLGQGMYGDNEYMVDAEEGTNLTTLAAQLEGAMRGQLEAGAVTFEPVTSEAAAPVVEFEQIDDWLTADDQPIGTLNVSPDGGIVRVIGITEERNADGSITKRNTHEAVEIKAKKLREQVGRLVNLRNTARRISKMQAAAAEPKVWKAEQKKGKKLLSEFWEKWGPINKETRRYRTVTIDEGDGKTREEEEVSSVSTPNLPKIFEKSASAQYAAVLESYDQASGKAKFSKWLTGEIGVAPEADAKAETISDAVILSLSSPATKGKVDIANIAAQLDITEAQAEERMRSEDVAYFSPAEGWMLRGPFLSGDVRTRLEQVKEAGLKAEQQILEDNQPGFIPASQIDPAMGQSWIKSHWRERYLNEKTGIGFNIKKAAVGSGWTVSQKGTITMTGWFRDMLNLGDTGESYSPGKFIKAVMNEATVRVFIGKGDDKAFSPEHTNKINAQISRMGKDFGAWLKREYREDAEKEFNEQQNRYAYVGIGDPGDVYKIPALSSDVSMWPHQRRAVFRNLVDGSMGLFHAVGAGKTLTMASIAVENKRLGLANKPAIIVPLSIQKQFAREAQSHFPNARILVADELSEGAGSEKGRSEDIRRFVSQVSASEWDMVLINKEQFKRIRLSPAAQARELERELNELLDVIEASKEEDAPRTTVKRLEAQRDKIHEQLEEQQRRVDEKADAGFTFEDTGIDMLVVDEGHNYKNLRVSSSIQEANLSGSQVASDLKQKINLIEDQLNPGRSVVMATGTPITNRIAEIHTMFRFIADAKLKAMDDFHLFENWRRQNTEIEPWLEQKSTGEWATKSRIGYNNMLPLQRFLWNNADIVTEEELDAYVTKPTKHYANEYAEAQPEIWSKFMDWIRFRYERLSKRQPIPIGSEEQLASKRESEWKEDNHLMLFADTMMGGIDMRFIDDTLPENKYGLIPRSAAKMAEIYHSTAANKYENGKKAGGVQAVFIDNYQRPAWGSSFNALTEIKRKLIEGGVKESHIGLLSDTGSDRKKREAMFAKARSGDIRIIIGNTRKMGEGVNIQQRLTNEHHLSVPYRPSDLTQREGRIWRKGNLNKNVTIHRWATRGVLGNAWDMIDRKSRTLTGLVSNKPVTEHSADDIGNALGADDIAATILGNPSVKLRAEARRDVQNMVGEREDLEAAWANAQTASTQIPPKIKAVEENIAALKAINDLYVAFQNDEKKKDIYGTFEGKDYKTLGDLTDAVKDKVGSNFRKRGMGMESDGTFHASVKGVDFDFEPGSSRYGRDLMGFDISINGGSPSYFNLFGDTEVVNRAFNAVRTQIYGAKNLAAKRGAEAKSLKTQLESSQKTLEGGRGWTKEKESALQMKIEDVDTITAQIAVDSKLEQQERAARAAEAGDGDQKVGKFFSVGRGSRPAFATNKDVQGEVEGIVRQIFPGVQGVYFSDALYGSGPALAASQKAAGVGVTQKAEIAGRMDRAKAIVEISLGAEFDPINTAHHEAYHLARMLMNTQEREFLMQEFGTEEDEAYAFADWNQGREQSIGGAGMLWFKIKTLFRGIGNALRGRGFNSVDAIFDKVAIGAIGARAQQEQMEGVQYAADRREKYLSATNRALNEVTPSDEDMVKQVDPEGKSQVRMSLEWLGQKMEANLYDENYIQKIWNREPGLTSGKLTVEAQAWRHLNLIARKTARKAAQTIKETRTAGGTPTDAELLEFNESLATLKETWGRANAMASEMGRALRAFREPLRPMGTKTIDSIESKIKRLSSGEDLESERVGGVDFSPQDLLDLLKEQAEGNKDFGMDSDLGDGDLMAMLRKILSGELDGMIQHWKNDPRALGEAIDAVISEDGGFDAPRQSQARWWEKLTWLWYNSLLSSPQTFARNGLSGAFMYAIASR